MLLPETLNSPKTTVRREPHLSDANKGIPDLENGQPCHVTVHQCADVKCHRGGALRTPNPLGQLVTDLGQVAIGRNLKGKSWGLIKL
jgi:hypothetical protein